MRIFLPGALCLLVGVSAVQAQEQATLPYAKIHDAFQKAAGVPSKDVRVAIAVESKDKAVKPGAVTLTIQTRRGPRKLRIDPDGEIRRFPMNDALLRENPPVVSNQPKGSLKLGGGLVFTAPTASRYSYRQLVALLDAGNAELRQQAGLISFVAPQAKGLQFEFFGPGRQTITVRSRTAPLTVTTDDRGNVSLPLDRALLAENPAVRLSAKPAKVLPAL